MDCAFAVNAAGGNLVELRIFLDFDAPALVVGQVPVHTIDFEQRQHVDVFLHVFGRHEVTARVEHNATIAKARFVLHANGRSIPADALSHRRAFDFGRKQLQERLHSIEQALSSFSLGCHAGGLHAQSVAFVAHFHCRVDDKVDAAFCSHLYSVAGRLIDFGSKEFGYGSCLGCLGTNSGVGSERKFATGSHQFLRHRDDVNASVVTFHIGLHRAAQVCKAHCDHRKQG